MKQRVRTFNIKLTDKHIEAGLHLQRGKSVLNYYIYSLYTFIYLFGHKIQLNTWFTRNKRVGSLFYFVFILCILRLDQSTSTSLTAVQCQPVIKESSRWHAASPSSEPGRPCASVCPISWRTAPSPRCWRTTPPPSAGWLSWWRTCRRARWRTPEASRWRRSDHHHLQEDQQGRSLCSRSLCSSLHTWPWGCR